MLTKSLQANANVCAAPLAAQLGVFALRVRRTEQLLQ